MIKVYTLNKGDVVLAEVRTDGKSYEVFDDMTNGAVERMGAGDWASLQNKIGKSSYLSLQLKQDQLPGVLRYILDNGDVVEATTDGLTYLLNGRLLPEQEKNQLQANIANGVVTVSQKQDIRRPSPIQEPYQPASGLPDLTSDEHKQKMQEWSKSSQAQIVKQDEGSVNWDEGIENMSLDSIERADTVRGMAYFLKYGKFKGRA